LGTRWRSLTAEERLRYAEWAHEDSQRCIDLFPQWNAIYPIHNQTLVYVAASRSEPRGFREIIRNIDELLDDDWSYGPLTPSERAFAINCRAQCYHFLGDSERARKDYDESIRLAPEEPRWLVNRAQYRDASGRPGLAAEDRRKADALR